jgi:mono/diheme cytochrome c family protein
MRFLASFGVLPAWGMLALLAVPGNTKAQDNLVERGRIIADTYCSDCHATGSTGASPWPDAPPMRQFKHRWPVESLAEALAEGIIVGHPEMPEVTMTPAEIDAFLAYLDHF